MTGDTLRKERERQKLTIQDIEEGTSIRAVYIEALEKGDYENLPGEVYAKGFVKNYANFLNLDAEKLSKEFSAEISPPTVVEVEDVSVAEEKIISESSRTEKLKITELKEPNVKVNRKSSASSGGSMIIAAVILIALFAGGAWYYLKNSSENVAKVNPPQQTENLPPSENSANNSVSAAPTVEGVNVQATFSGDCWTRVYVDGVFTYEGVPTAGQVMNWQGIEGVTMRVGNAGAVDIVMNGQPFGSLGAVGEVTERTFTKDLLP